MLSCRKVFSIPCRRKSYPWYFATNPPTKARATTSSDCAFFLSPGILPFWNGFRPLEQAWISFAEYAADEAAVAGDAQLSLALASSLVHVARLGTASRLSASAISFLEDASDLSVRVDRLLNKSSLLESPRSISWRKPGLALILAGGLALILFTPITFQFVQSILERLIR